MKKDAKRAGELSALAEKLGRLFPMDVWPPETTVINCWTGGSMGPYLRQLPRYFGEPPVHDLGLLASEGRFTIRYCPGHLTREEIESVHYEYGDLAEAMKKYDPQTLEDGWNTVDGEEIFYISNPGLGLWAYEGRFKN